MNTIKSFIKENKYKLLVFIVVIGVMLMTIIRTYRFQTARVISVGVEKFGLDFLNKTTFFTLMFLVVALCVMSILLHKDKLKIEHAFLGMGIIFGVIYMFMLPPFTVPDEAVHIDTTYYYSSKLLGEQALDENGLVLYRAGDMIYNHNEHMPNIKSYARLFNNLFQMDHSNGETALSGRGPIGQLPTAYAPPIIGVTLARLLHLGGVQMLMWGRMFALAFYLLCVYWTIKLAPIGKELLLVVGLLPMGLQEAASFSYDSSVMAICYLFTGFLLYLTFEASRVTWKHIAFLMVLFAWVSPSKVVYVGMAFAMLIIPKEKFGGIKRKYLMFGGVLFAGLAAILLTRFSTVTAVGSGVTSVGEVQNYSISYLIHNPFKVVTVSFETIINLGAYYLDTMIGQRFGWLEIYVPEYYVFGFFTLLVLASMRLEKEKDVLQPGQRLWIFLICAGVTFLIGLAFLFDWTTIDFPYVVGIQGRYFLPILPLLMILFKNHQIELKNVMSKYLCVAVFVLQFFTINQIIHVISGR